MNLDLGLQLAHAAGAIVWVGGDMVLAIVCVRYRRGGNLTVIGEFARTASSIGVKVITPAALVVLVSGVWLVLASSDWTLSQPWVLLALGAFVVAVLISAVYLRRSASHLEQASTDGAPDRRAAREALDRLLLGYGLVLISLVFALWDMAFKPGS
jgi:uncharacterized membrane protein